MKYALFLGCTVPARGRGYEVSVRKVANILGIEFEDLEDFGCCGFPLKSLSTETTLLMAARALSIAEEKGLNICAVCSACTSVLTEASKELLHEEVREQVNKKLKDINREYKGKVMVKHFNRVLYEDIGLENIQKAIKTQLSNFKIAAHYGCHYLKPSEIYDKFDDPENPKTLDKLIEVTGAQSVNYEYRKQCCGGGVLAVDENVALTLAKEKLTHITSDSVDAMCLVCPFCAVMYDDNQRTIEGRFSKTFNLPILYYPQLLGLALGIESKELGFNFNKVKTADFLAKLTPK